MKPYQLFIIYFTVVILAIPFWLRASYGLAVNFAQILFHLTISAEHLHAIDSFVIKKFIQYFIILPCIITISAACIAWLLSKTPLTIIRSRLAGSKRLLPYIPLLALCITAQQIGMVPYVMSLYSEDHFSKHYQHPNASFFTAPKHKKNLLLIYIESLEYNLRNEQIHQRNLISAIDALPGQNAHIVPAPGTNWSMAGMVSSQCGIPFKMFHQLQRFYAKLFLPSAICLGDVLNGLGYAQYFLVSSDVKFAGMDKFYQSHGYQAVYGRDEWMAMQVDPQLFTSWDKGIHDDSLFAQASKIIAAKEQEHTPYNITIMTTDSHAPHGYKSPRCKSTKNESDFRAAFTCTSNSLSNFITELKKKGLLQNTIVVIMGDHQFMAPAELTHAFPDPRLVYFKILNATKKIQRTNITHFDVAPTILDSLDILSNAQNKFGLGLSAFLVADESWNAKHLQTILHPNIMNFSPTYQDLWTAKD